MKVAIASSGKGTSPAEKRNLYQDFYQGDDTRGAES